MNPRSAIQKGKELEDYISSQIRRYGLDAQARRSAGSGSGKREKADVETSLTILGRNAGIEAKNHKSAAVQDWWRQAQKLEVLGREPLVVYKLFREPLEEAKAIIYLDTLLQLLKRAQEPLTVNSDNRELQWKIRNAKRALDVLSKSLPES